MRTKWVFLLAPVMVVAAACSSSGGGAAPTGSTTSGGSTTAGSAAGQGAKKLPGGTIGVLEIQGSAEIISRMAHDIATANSKMGWKTDVEDGKGDPAVLGQAMTNFIAKKVDAIVAIAVDSPAIAPQIKQAKAAGIPVISAPFDVSDPTHLYTANFGPDMAGYVKTTVDYLKRKYPSGANYVQVNIPSVFAASGFIAAMDGALKAAGFTQQGNADGNVADLVNSITSGTANVVQAHPHAQILLSCCDFTPPIQIAALKAAGRSNVLLVGRFDNLSSLKLFADGANMILGAGNATSGAMEALDAIYAKKASGTPIPTNNPQTAYKFATIDKSNAPAAGKFFFDPQSQIDTFVAKWSNEYAR